MKKNQDIVSLIDKYGDINKEIKVLSETKEKLKKELLEYLEIGKYEGNKYEITISDVVTYTYNASKVLEKIGKSKFLECVKVLSEKVKQFIPPHDLQKFVENTETSKKLVVKERF